MSDTPTTLLQIDSLAAHSPYRDLHVDRSLDDSGNVIFLHLGRGIAKSTSGQIGEGRTTPEAWIRFADEFLLAQFEEKWEAGC